MASFVSWEPRVLWETAIALLDTIAGVESKPGATLANIALSQVCAHHYHVHQERTKMITQQVLLDAQSVRWVLYALEMTPNTISVQVVLFARTQGYLRQRSNVLVGTCVQVQH
jgi:hypothetical protein